MIQELTPHRRQSLRGSNLSDPQWFIRDYEKRVPEEYRYPMWDKLSEKEKADQVVKMRYSSMLANTIKTYNDGGLDNIGIYKELN